MLPTVGAMEDICVKRKRLPVHLEKSPQETSEIEWVVSCVKAKTNDEKFLCHRISRPTERVFEDL